MHVNNACTLVTIHLTASLSSVMNTFLSWIQTSCVFYSASLHVHYGQDRVHYHGGRCRQETGPSGLKRQNLDPRDAPAGHRQGGQVAGLWHTGTASHLSTHHQIMFACNTPHIQRHWFVFGIYSITHKASTSEAWSLKDVRILPAREFLIKNALKVHYGTCWIHCF